jgi:hypothetical protein
MASIFGDIKMEQIVQVNDKTRIDCSATFVSKDSAPITALEIEPEAGNGFIDVYTTNYKNWFLDWKYSTNGIKAVSLRITTDGAPVVFTSFIESILAVDDGLLSADADIIIHEPDILNYVRIGRSSYLDYHRRTRDLILDWLDENNWTDINGDRLTKDTFVNKEPFRKWSAYMTLSLIFGGISNAVDDVFRIKSKDYDKKANEARDRGEWKIDMDNDGIVSTGEGIDIRSLNLYRR